MSVDTHYLPSGRAAIADIERQSRAYTNSSRHSELMDFIPEMVLVLNRERQVVYANETTLGLLQAAGETILGLRPGEALHCIHADEMPGGCGTAEACRYCGAAQALAQAGRGRPDSRECRLRIRTQDGEQALDLRIWSRPFSIDGEAYTFVVMADIHEEQRRRALEKLFIHDIMNTASNVNGFSRLLRGHDDLAPVMRQKILARVEELSEHLVAEIDSQRILIEAENGSLAVRPEPIDSLAMLESVRTAWAARGGRAAPDVVIGPDAVAVTFTSDPVLLRRVLGNLVKNAIEASQAGQIVALRCERAPGGVAFEVHNESVMPEAVRLQVFNRCFTTRSTGQGLGTYSVKFFTEHYLGGNVSFDSREGEGTTFRVWLPLHASA